MLRIPGALAPGTPAQGRAFARRTISVGVLRPLRGEPNMFWFGGFGAFGGSKSAGARREDSTLRGVRPADVMRSRRVLVIALLGFSSGLPLLLTGQTLTAWMTAEGVSLKA